MPYDHGSPGESGGQRMFSSRRCRSSSSASLTRTSKLSISPSSWTAAPAGRARTTPRPRGRPAGRPPPRTPKRPWRPAASGACAGRSCRAVLPSLQPSLPNPPRRAGRCPRGTRKANRARRPPRGREDGHSTVSAVRYALLDRLSVARHRDSVVDLLWRDTNGRIAARAPVATLAETVANVDRRLASRDASPAGSSPAPAGALTGLASYPGCCTLRQFRPVFRFGGAGPKEAAG